MDLNINRVSFEEIEEFHDLDVSTLPDGQYNIVAVVDSGKVSYVINQVGTGGGGSVIPPLRSVIAVGNTSEEGINIYGKSSIEELETDILETTKLITPEIEIYLNNIKGSDSIFISALNNITLSSINGEPITINDGIYSFGDIYSTGTIDAKGIMTAEDPDGTDPQGVVTVNYMTNNFSSTSFLNVDGSSKMLGDIDLNSNKLKLAHFTDSIPQDHDVEIFGSIDNITLEKIATITSNVNVEGNVIVTDPNESDTDIDKYAATRGYVNSLVGVLPEPPSFLEGFTMGGPINMSENKIAFGHDSTDPNTSFIQGTIISPDKVDLEIKTTGALEIEAVTNVNAVLTEKNKEVITSEQFGTEFVVKDIWVGSQQKYDKLVDDNDDDTRTLYIIL